MKCFRLTIAFLLTLAIPVVASAGVRMQVAMDLAQMQTGMANGATVASAKDGCDMASNDAEEPGKSMPCCMSKQGQDCKICSLPASVSPSCVTFSPQSFSQVVVARSDAVAHSEDASGMWRPPRQL